MGFFDTLKEIITNKPSNLREPKFIKEFNDNNNQIKYLEELLEKVPQKTLKEIQQKIKILSYGLLGEKNVAYELKNSHMPILVLHDLYLRYEELTAQIDFVVIAQRFILVIECKNMVGDIEITSSGDFIRCFKSASGKTYKREGIYSPIVQNERHVKILLDILNNEGYLIKDKSKFVHHVVTIANPKAIIHTKYAKKELKEHLIKHEQLINKMKQLQNDNKDNSWLTEKTMYNVVNSLSKYSDTYTIDYKEKYNINEETQNTNIANIDVSEIFQESSLYKELKDYRLNKSREEKIKPYFLYSNKQLESIIKIKPKNIEELKSIKGFGDVKCNKYGEDIIEIIKNNI